MFKYVPPVVDESTAAAAIAAAEAQDAKDLEEAAGEVDSADAAGANGVSLSAGVAGAVVSADADGEGKKRKRIQPTSIASLDVTSFSSADGASALPTPPQSTSVGAVEASSSVRNGAILPSATVSKIQKRIAPQRVPDANASTAPMVPTEAANNAAEVESLMEINSTVQG